MKSAMQNECWNNRARRKPVSFFDTSASEQNCNWREQAFALTI
jgi:hypothetical protein